MNGVVNGNVSVFSQDSSIGNYASFRRVDCVKFYAINRFRVQRTLNKFSAARQIFKNESLRIYFLSCSSVVCDAAQCIAGV